MQGSFEVALLFSIAALITAVFDGAVSRLFAPDERPRGYDKIESLSTFG
jgi:hypothetical protein